MLVALLTLNRMRVRALWPRLMLGAVLWLLVLLSGVHATVAGVALALTIPLTRAKEAATNVRSICPDAGACAGQGRAVRHHSHFGFANAGVSLAGFDARALVDPLTLGIAGGLVLGKVVGVYGTARATVKLGWAAAPVGAAPLHVLGVALLCGIGFTMSLFIGLLAFLDSAALQDGVKIGILLGSLVSAVLGRGPDAESEAGGAEARAFLETASDPDCGQDWGTGTGTGTLARIAGECSQR